MEVILILTMRIFDMILVTQGSLIRYRGVDRSLWDLKRHAESTTLELPNPNRRLWRGTPNRSLWDLWDFKTRWRKWERATSNLSTFRSWNGNKEGEEGNVEISQLSDRETETKKVKSKREMATSKSLNFQIVKRKQRRWRAKNCIENWENEKGQRRISQLSDRETETKKVKSKRKWASWAHSWATFGLKKKRSPTLP